MGTKSSKVGTYESQEHLELPEKDDDPIKYDELHYGPIKNRGCTDVLCCMLFAIFVVAFMIIGLYAFVMGDPRILIYPTDSEGNICGVGEFKDRPNLFYFDLIECFIRPDKSKVDLSAIMAFGCRTPQICVSHCPNSSWTWVSWLPPGIPAVPDLSRDVSRAICKYGVTPTAGNLDNLIKNDTCAPYYVPSDSIVFRCIPSFLKDGIDKLAAEISGHLVDKNNSTVNATDLNSAITQLQALLNLRDFGMKILGDVTASWWLILIFVLIAAVLSLIWITLMRWLAGVIVWLTIALFAGFFVFAIYYCFNKYTFLKSANSTMTGSGIPYAQYTQLDYYINLYQTWLAMGIIACIILGVIVIVLLFLRTRLLIAIALIKEASKALLHMVSILFWPLIPYALQVIFLAYWGASAICLAAASRDTDPCTNSKFNDSYTHARCQAKNMFFNNIPCNTSASGAAGDWCRFAKNGGDRYIIVLQAFQLFTWLWVMNFVIALGQITLAGSFASYYWAFDKPKDIPTFPLLSAFRRALRYHLGSLAFGALIIAIIQFIRIILEYIDHKLKKSESAPARFAVKCCKCCFWCLEKFMKFINANAYIMIAIYGKSFCTSAKHAFFLILRNCIRVFVVDKVADFLIFISKLFIVGAVGVLAYFFFTREIPGVRDVITTPNLSYYLIPVIIIIVTTYVVACCFFSVYNVGVDTLFLCFLEDLERNDGSAEKPYFMSTELMSVLGKTNKKTNAATPLSPDTQKDPKKY